MSNPVLLDEVCDSSHLGIDQEDLVREVEVTSNNVVVQKRYCARGRGNKQQCCGARKILEINLLPKDRDTRYDSPMPSVERRD